MSKSLKLVLISIAGLIVLGFGVTLLLSRVDVKSPFETFASDATGMEVTAGGAVRLRIFPVAHVTLRDVHVRNKGAEIASVGEAYVAVALLPLLHKQVHITSVTLQRLNLSIEKGGNGKFNFEHAGHGDNALPATNLPSISFSNASFRYTNRQTARQLIATDCKLSGGRAQIAQDGKQHIMKRLSVDAQMTCAQVRNNQFSGTDAHFKIEGRQGVFELKPVTMQALGGKGTGNIHADFTAEVPAYQVHYAAAKLHMDELLKSLSAKYSGTGLLDFSTDLSMRGFDATEMTRTAQGEAVVSGNDLTLTMGNLDEKFSRYESSQNFNLIDVGAFLLAGPLGTAVTKGYDFATVMQGTQGDTAVRTMISHWKVEQGVAYATDVAMATQKNRVAMKGGLDFVNRQFDDVTIALLDDKGCSRVEQKVHGPFTAPQIEKPNVLISLAGPVTRLLRKAGDLVGSKCDAFYTGSIAPP